MIFHLVHVKLPRFSVSVPLIAGFCVKVEKTREESSHTKVCNYEEKYILNAEHALSWQKNTVGDPLA